MTYLNKRNLLIGAGALGLGGLLPTQSILAQPSSPKEALPNLAANAKPIAAAEHQARIEKAQSLMQEQGIGALVIESGSALTYFTGIRWWRSERFTGVVIPAEGEFTVITPFFEEPSIRESMIIGEDVRTWHEDASPFKLIVDVLRENKALNKPVAIEETTRNFISTGIKAQNAGLELVSGQQITRGCRLYKSPAELALMQTANDITMAAYRDVYPQIEMGMTRRDISALMNKATTALGGSVEFSLVLVGPSSAYPHGSDIEYELKEGQVILMDCGCSVHDYESDISRSWVMGDATQEQRDVWNTVKRGQELALETATIGTPAGRVDAVVRTYYESLGYGPDYATPGLTHRLGHGIGLDGHEPVNFVRGEKTKLAPGMCFSNEPGLYLPGKFGIRLEDCLHMAEDGPVLFSPLSKSLDDPFGA